MCAKMHSEPDGRSCTAPQTSPYGPLRHVRLGRRVVAHLGRFLPRLGPFVFPGRPLLYAVASGLFARSGLGTALALQSYVPSNFCNAKRIGCILCAAHLHRRCEAGDPVARFAALLGRFLPRLGPHGSPRGPFYFAMRRANEGHARMRRLRRGRCNPKASLSQPSVWYLLLQCNIGDASAPTHAPILRRRGARARGAAPRIL
jgi:hypothetical protein